jgi:hypothetical protein
MKLLNSFSVQMLAEFPATAIFTEIPKPDLSSAESFIGHADTAAVLGVPMNRANVSLKRGDRAIIAQLTGGRLPEGATTLPAGFSFKWISVEIR